MRLPRSHDVAESEDAAGEIEHVAVRADERFTGQLAGAVGGDWNHWAMVFVHLSFTQVAIHAAARRIEDGGRSRTSHGLEDIIGKVRPFTKVDVRFGGRASNVRIGGEMNHHIVTANGRSQRVEILHIAANHSESGVPAMLFIVPFTAG